MTTDMIPIDQSMDQDFKDQRELLIKEYADVASQADDSEKNIEEMQDKLDGLRQERESLNEKKYFLQDVLDKVLIEHCDPVLAKFQIGEDYKARHSNKKAGSVFLSASSTNKSRRRNYGMVESDTDVSDDEYERKPWGAIFKITAHKLRLRQRPF
jgi:uncharacterized protein YoxC